MICNNCNNQMEKEISIFNHRISYISCPTCHVSCELLYNEFVAIRFPINDIRFYFDKNHESYYHKSGFFQHRHVLDYQIFPEIKIISKNTMQINIKDYLIKISNLIPLL